MYHTKVILAGKCGDPMELTNALAVGYIDPALEGQTVMFICPLGQILNGYSSTCMGNGEWEPDPTDVECTGTPVTTTTSLVTTTMGICTCHTMMYNASISELIIIIIVIIVYVIIIRPVFTVNMFVFISNMQQSILCTSNK